MSWDVPDRWNPGYSGKPKVTIMVISEGSYVATTSDFLGGSVTERWASGVRSSLSLTVAPTPQWLQWFALPRLELQVFSGFDWVTSEFLCPLGIFPVDPVPPSLPASQVTVSAQDRWQNIVLDDFAYTQSSMAYLRSDLYETSVPIRDAVARMIDQTDLGPETVVSASRSDALPNVMLQKTRDATIKELVESIGAEAFVDRQGVPQVRDRASQPGRPISDGNGGTLLGITESWDYQETFNRVGVSTSNTDSVFFPVFVEITDTTHPAHWSKMRKRTMRYSSPLLTNADQALAAGRTLLAQKSSVARSWSVECIPDPSRMPGDVVTVTSDLGVVTGVVNEVKHPLGDGSQTIVLGAA